MTTHDDQRTATPANMFTLVELLVVISIIAVLAGLLLPALKRARDMALSAKCQGNQRQCGVALAGYASDFDDWVIGGEASLAYVAYPILGSMMMQLGYAPANGIDYDATYTGAYLGAPVGNVYSCPSLSPPAAYKQWATNWPYKGYQSNSAQSYGLRFITPGTYQNEIHASFRGAVRYSSLYQPSQLPYMVDTLTYAKEAGGTAVGGPTQWHCWYPSGGDWGLNGACGALQLRHNKRANVWFPDGHVGSWAATDALSWRCPENGSMTIGYKY